VQSRGCSVVNHYFGDNLDASVVKVAMEIQAKLKTAAVSATPSTVSSSPFNAMAPAFNPSATSAEVSVNTSAVCLPSYAPAAVTVSPGVCTLTLSDVVRVINATNWVEQSAVSSDGSIKLRLDVPVRGVLDEECVLVHPSANVVAAMIVKAVESATSTMSVSDALFASLSDHRTNFLINFGRRVEWAKHSAASHSTLPDGLCGYRSLYQAWLQYRGRPGKDPVLWLKKDKEDFKAWLTGRFDFALNTWSVRYAHTSNGKEHEDVSSLKKRKEQVFGFINNMKVGSKPKVTPFMPSDSGGWFGTSLCQIFRGLDFETSTADYFPVIRFEGKPDSFNYLWATKAGSWFRVAEAVAVRNYIYFGNNHFWLVEGSVGDAAATREALRRLVVIILGVVMSNCVDSGCGASNKSFAFATEVGVAKEKSSGISSSLNNGSDYSISYSSIRNNSSSDNSNSSNVSSYVTSNVSSSFSSSINDSSCYYNNNNSASNSNSIDSCSYDNSSAISSGNSNSVNSSSSMSSSSNNSSSNNSSCVNSSSSISNNNSSSNNNSYNSSSSISSNINNSSDHSYSYADSESPTVVARVASEEVANVASVEVASISDVKDTDL